MTRTLVSAAALAVALASSVASADEGMWLPSQAPVIADELQKAGIAMDPAALGNLQAAPLNAIASLGGCSASFVSPDGLVITNHHCVYGSIQYNASPEKDLLEDGFLAKSNAQDLPAAPGTRIWAIEELRDVTADMMKGVGKKTKPLNRWELLDANKKKLIADCEAEPNRRCDVRAYFGGARYYLQRQFEIQDVRLVYAPARGVGNFGGETDNWMWPRHTGDYGFYRAYVAKDGSSAPFSKDNVPYRPANVLKVAKDGLKDGDFVMVAGFPGRTNRLVTAAEAESNFRTLIPNQQKMLADYSDVIARLTAGDEAATIKYASIIRGADNYKKNMLGQLAGAEAIGLVERKKADEARYRKWIAASAKRSALASAAKDLDAVIAEGISEDRGAAIRYAVGRPQLLDAAQRLYRWAKERDKPDAQREAGYQDRDRKTLTDSMTQIERRFDPRVDRGIMEWAMAEYRTLPADQQDPALLAKIDEIGMDGLYSGTKLSDTAERLAWLDRPASAFESSTDPFIRLAVAAFPRAEERRNDVRTREGRDQAARSVYLQGMRDWAETEGRTLYPDANGSLRLTYGNVKGKTVDGQVWTPFTTVEGMAAKHRGSGEFNAPKAALDAAKRKDYGRWAAPELGSVPVNFLSTVDTTGGNSGSAALNDKGELVGLLFDGTLEGVVSDWMYNDAINRSIQVDMRYVLWTMEKVDKADRLMKEMGVE